MSRYISLTCPKCEYTRVYNCRGRCRCGAYLVAAWKGINTHHAFVITDRVNTYFLNQDGTWTHASDVERSGE
jgi:hypothetical protein